MDLLLDVNIVVDICAPREAFEEAARDALALCKQSGGQVWMYAGSVQTLEYTLYHKLKRQYAAAKIHGSNRQGAAGQRDCCRNLSRIHTGWLLWQEKDLFLRPKIRRMRSLSRP